MRNLKRALSLALAAVMLLGMMITGAGAASTSFTDFDQIVNQEAAEVTSGLKIFEGYTNGTFGPENVVTRAEMAVIICKLLNGSDVDPGNFTDIKTFDDVPAWAEGYVNYCASMGIVVGVGERKFNPNATVSTVEAATMLLKALGYFIEEDQLGADWKTVVTGRATSLHLYGDLTLGVDEGLTRDNVAELVFHTLFAQRVAYDDNRHLYVKNTNRDVVVTNGTEDPYNTFAMNTFGMWYVDGVVTANSFTLDSLSETTNNAPRTNVVFDEATDMGQGAVASYPFEYTTGLDMIGHAARTYYSIERRAPVVYAIVDMATKVEYITYNSNTTLLANAANDAGFRRNTILQIPTNDYKVNYSWTDTVGTLNSNPAAGQWDDGEVNLTGPSVNKTLIAISNSSDYQVDYVIVLDQYLDTVKRAVETSDGVMDYDLTTGDGNDQNIAHDDFAAGDYVVVTDVGNQGRMLNLTAPEKVTASITKITGVSDSDGTVKKIIADGTEYSGSPVAHHEDAKQRLTNTTRSLDNTTNFEAIQTIAETTLLLDFQGKCIGIAEPETVTNYAYAAQFGVTHNNGSLNLDTQYALTVKLHFIDGTSGVYMVNTSAGTAATNTFKNLSMGTTDAYARDTAELLNNGINTLTGSYPAYNGTAVYDPHDNYGANLTVIQSGTDKGQLRLNANSLGAEQGGETDTGLGIYKVSMRGDNSVVLQKLTVDETANADQPGVRLIPGHSTLVRADGQNVKRTGGRDMYQTAKTAYFYVDGCRTDAGNKPDTAAKTYAYSSSGLSVGVKTGLTNAVGITRGGNKDENNNYETFEQVFVTPAADSRDRDVISAVLIYGYDMGSSDALYFYKEGNYHLTDKDGAQVTGRADTEHIAITYDMYNADGELYQATYNNGGKYYDIETATDMARSHATGYYKLGKDIIEEQYVSSGVDQKLTDNNNLVDGAKNIYVLNAEAKHDEFEDNFYTSVDAVAGITSSTLVVDTTGNGIDSITDIARHCIAGDTVRVSYTYKTTGDDAYKVKVVFVTGFSPKGTNVPVSAKFTRVSYDSENRRFVVRWHATDYPLTDTASIMAGIESVSGLKVSSVNPITGYVFFEGQAFPGTMQTVETYKVTYGNRSVYLDKANTVSTVDAADLNLAESTNYLVGVTNSGVPATVSASTKKLSLGVLTGDTTIYLARTLTIGADVTVTIGTNNVSGARTWYVANGTQINATATNPGGATIGVEIKDTAETPKVVASGTGTVTYTVATDVTLTKTSGYKLEAGDGVEISYVDANGTRQTIKSGSSAVVASGTNYTVLSADATRYFFIGGTGTTVQQTSYSATTSTADLLIDGDYVKVKIGNSSATTLSGLSGTPRNDGSDAYMKATAEIQPTTPAATETGIEMRTTSAYVAYGTTYGEADKSDNAQGTADGLVDINAVAKVAANIYGADGSLIKTLAIANKASAVAVQTAGGQGTYCYVGSDQASNTTAGVAVDDSVDVSGGQDGDVNIYTGYYKWVMTNPTNANRVDVTAQFSINGSTVAGNTYYLKATDVVKLTVTATAEITGASTGPKINTQCSTLAAANVSAQTNDGHTLAVGTDLTIAAGVVALATGSVLQANESVVITYPTPTTADVLGTGVAITNA